ncbi:MAG: hypothetical protein JWM93_2440 [Frankiales bacterium]|nr:hypothetical protein [Frankiales bacterium]
MTTATVPDAETVEHLDFALPCEIFPVHERAGTGDAEWVIRLAKCCEELPPTHLACDGCLRRLMQVTGSVSCSRCGWTVPSIHVAILSVEPLRPGGAR